MTVVREIAATKQFKYLCCVQSNRAFINFELEPVIVLFSPRRFQSRCRAFASLGVFIGDFSAFKMLFVNPWYNKEP